MSTSDRYQPPYSITPAVLTLVAEIGEIIGRYTALAERHMMPRLRRENRIRTIQASLAIENNTLTLEQVTAVIEGKRVLGHPREIQEVRNAFSAYDAMEAWDARSDADLLAAHGVIMRGLVDNSGRSRSGGVGIFRGEHPVHMAPPGDRVPMLMADLLGWLSTTDEHPLVASCVFHYELEFIHPFEDGNGRMGRLWQTLILRSWKPLLTYVPVETVIHAQQEAYYEALAEADRRATATPFIIFMLRALRDAIQEAVAGDQVNDQVSDQVIALLRAIGSHAIGSTALMESLGIRHRPTFRAQYLNPALKLGLIERTQPDAPRSPTQRYLLTPAGRRRLNL
jgi:Fic family protein